MESNISVLLIRCPARRNAQSIASYVTRVVTQSGGLSNESEYMISYGWVLINTDKMQECMPIRKGSYEGANYTPCALQADFTLIAADGLKLDLNEQTTSGNSFYSSGNLFVLENEAAINLIGIIFIKSLLNLGGKVIISPVIGMEKTKVQGSENAKSSRQRRGC